MFRIDTHIPYGNACDILVGHEGNTPIVSFAADPHGGPECLWFCFSLQRDDPDSHALGKVKLVFKHFRNVLGGETPEKLRPVIRRAGGDWARMDRGTTETLPDGQYQGVWFIEPPESFVDIALCYPYGRPEIEALLRETHGYWHADSIGVSQAARPLIRLSNGYAQRGDDRPGLYLIARQHSGETPGSWVLDGFLRHIATLGKDAPLVWAAPLANIDGVEQGDYGKDNFPYDVNRGWGAVPMRHENLVIERDMGEWAQRCRPAIGIDFHAPGACEMDGIYAFAAVADQLRRKTTQPWADAIAKELGKEYVSEPFLRVPGYRSRWETPRFDGHCFDQIGMAGLSVETPYSMIGEVVLTRERYQEAGARMAAAVARMV